MAVMAHTCSLRGIFPGVRAAGENDLASFRRQRRRKPGRGCGPFLELPRDEGRGTGSPRSAAIFYWECLLSGSPRSGIAGGRAAAAAGRETEDGRGRFAVRRRRGTGAGARVTGPPGRWSRQPETWPPAPGPAAPGGRFPGGTGGPALRRAGAGGASAPACLRPGRPPGSPPL